MRFSSQYQNQKHQNLIYQPNAINKQQKDEILSYLSTLYPIWEMRYSKHNPPPQQEENRSLLRPVYWLGNWQFACLNYYHPPQGIHHRCVMGEGYPPVLQKIIFEVESLVHQKFAAKDVPEKWHLNTCLINFYGDKIVNNERQDCARVGEHKDFEPGPVASISFGEKALIQFVKSDSKSQKSQIILQQWLEDSSLQIFGGDKFKKQLFHRVQRVENKGFVFKNLKTTQFETRRINFTFRYVPIEHIQPLSRLPENQRNDIKNYVAELSTQSEFWKEQYNEAYPAL